MASAIFAVASKCVALLIHDMTGMQCPTADHTLTW